MNATVSACASSLIKSAGGDEGGPGGGVGAEALAAARGEDAETCVAHRLRGAEPAREARLVERPHPRPGRLVFHRPQGRPLMAEREVAGGAAAS